MKNLLSLVLVIVAFLSSSCLTSKSLVRELNNANAVKIDGIADVDSVFEYLQKEYLIAEELIKKNTDLKEKVTITEANVKFDNVKTNTVDGSLKILILKGEGKFIKKDETSISFNLKSASNSKQPFTDPKPGELANLIYRSALTFHKMKNKAFDTLTKKSFVIEISFSAGNNETIDLGGSISGLTLDANYVRDRQYTNSIKLTFEVVK